MQYVCISQYCSLLSRMSYHEIPAPFSSNCAVWAYYTHITHALRRYSATAVTQHQYERERSSSHVCVSNLFIYPALGDTCVVQPRAPTETDDDDENAAARSMKVQPCRLPEAPPSPGREILYTHRAPTKILLHSMY